MAAHLKDLLTTFTRAGRLDRVAHSRTLCMPHGPYESLAVCLTDRVAEVQLLGPGKGNRMGMALFRELPIAFAALDIDDAVRAIVLRGSGSTFSSGMDIAELSAAFGPAAATGTDRAFATDRRALLGFIERGQDAITWVERCRKPVIAAVAGWCIGGGVDLITACDVRVCARDAKFAIREVKMAMVPELGTLQRLPHIVGQGVARELAFTGDDFDAARAKRIGLVNAVYESHEELFQRAHDMARRVAENSPVGVEGSKRILNGAIGKSVAESLREVALWNSAFLPSKDLQEALVAFAEKRAPRFIGK
jgi:enoyl-CoA hydratase